MKLENQNLNWGSVDAHLQGCLVVARARAHLFGGRPPRWHALCNWGAGEKTVKNSPLPHLSPRRLRADSQVKIWSLKPLEDEDVEEAGMQQSDEEENEVRLFFSFSPAHSHV